MNPEFVPTGKVDVSRIRSIAPDRVADATVEAFRALGDVTSAVSDALDELGLRGAIAATTMHPCQVGARVVGTALTLRNSARSESVDAAMRRKQNGMGDIECHNLARPGDVLVIQGVPHASNLGGVSSRIARRQGELGAIVDGGVRDIADFNENQFPVWCSAITPMTGKWRIETTEVNGPVLIQGIAVSPGDLVVADATGICFVPRQHAEEVLAFVRRKLAAEYQSCVAVDAGWTVPQLAGGQPPPSSPGEFDRAASPVADATDRMPPIPIDQWTTEQRHYAQEIISGPRGALISPFIPLLRSPELMSLAQRMGEYLRYRGSLGPRRFELAVLLVARHWRQKVEWAIHAPIAMQEGWSEQAVTAIANGQRPSDMEEGESSIYEFVEQILATGRISDEVWESCKRTLGDQGVIDLLGVCGYYGTLAMVMNAAMTPVPDTSQTYPPLN